MALALWLPIAGVSVDLVAIFSLGVFLLQRGGPSPRVSVARVARSRFESLPVPVLAGIRGAISAYVFIVLGFDVALNGAQSFFMYTVWNWTILGIYFGAASTVSLTWWARGGSEKSPDAGGDWPGLARAIQGGCAIILTNVLMVDILLWGILYPRADSELRGNFFTYPALNEHVVNFAFAAFELIVHDVPCCAKDLGTLLVLVVSYAVFTISRIAAVPAVGHCLTTPCAAVPGTEDGFVAWPYFFMDTSTLVAVPWYLALAALQLAFAVLVFGIRRCVEGLRAPQDDIRRALGTSLPPTPS